MPVETNLRLRNDYSELTAVSEATTGFLEENGIGPEVVFAANLAIEELVTNIIKYGYDDQDVHEIHVHLAKHPDHLAICICDDGHPFNPFDQPTPDTSLPAEERDIGGLGIHFVRNMLDSCEHKHHEGKNIVTVTKKL
jgi:serine/threonine-protein kinase RsbW